MTQLKAVLIGQINNVVVFVPRADLAVQLHVAAIHKVALAVNLDVFPGELLPNPVKTRVRDHLDLSLTLRDLDFLL